MRNQNHYFFVNLLLSMAGNDLHEYISLVWCKRNAFVTILVEILNFMGIEGRNFSIKIKKMTPSKIKSTTFFVNPLLSMVGNDLHEYISLV